MKKQSVNYHCMNECKSIGFIKEQDVIHTHIHTRKKKNLHSNTMSDKRKKKELKQ